MAVQALAAIALAGEFELWPTRRAILGSRARPGPDGPQLVFGGFPVDLGRLSSRMGGPGRSAEGLREASLAAVAELLQLPPDELRAEDGPGFFLDGSIRRLLDAQGLPLDRLTARNLWCYRWGDLPDPDRGEIVYYSAEPSIAGRLAAALWARSTRRGKRAALLDSEGRRLDESGVDLLIIAGDFDDAALDEVESLVDGGESSALMIGVFPPGWSPPGPPLEDGVSQASSLALTGVGLGLARRVIRSRQGLFDPRIQADRDALTESAQRVFEGPVRRKGRRRPMDSVYRLLSLCPEGLEEDFILSFPDISAGDLAARASEGRIVRDGQGCWRLPRPPRLQPDPSYGELAEHLGSSDPRTQLYRVLAEIGSGIEGGPELVTLLSWMRERLDGLEEREILELTAPLDPGALGLECVRLRLEAAISALDLTLSRELLAQLPAEESEIWKIWIDLEDALVPVLEISLESLKAHPRVLAECALHDIRKPGRRVLPRHEKPEELLECALEETKDKLRRRYEILKVAAGAPERLFDEEWAEPYLSISPGLENLISHKRALVLSREEKWDEARKLLEDLLQKERRPGHLGILSLDLASVLAGSEEELHHLLRSLRLLEAAGFQERPRQVLFNIAMCELEELRLEKARSRLEKLRSDSDLKICLARALLALGQGDLGDFAEYSLKLEETGEEWLPIAWMKGVLALMNGDFSLAGEELARGGEDAEAWLFLLRALQGREFSGSTKWDPWGIEKAAELVARQRRFGRVRLDDVDLSGKDAAQLLRLALVDFLLRDESWMGAEMRARLAEALDRAGMSGWASSVESSGDRRMEVFIKAAARVLESGCFDVLSREEIQAILDGIQLSGLRVLENDSGKEILSWGEGELQAQMSRGSLQLQLLGGSMKGGAGWKLLFALLDTILRIPDEGVMIPQDAMGLLGESPAMDAVREGIARVSPSGLTVLIQGETGVGKDLVARAIHRLSEREGALVTVNVAGVTDTLFESELFGVVRGAFTGADRDRVGLVEEADGGTLFLDEIGDLALGSQVKLLRFLESGEIRRVGASRSRKVDVRVLAATHRNLEKMVEEGSFREDLYYRIVSARIEVPPLRERGGDILLLRDFFAQAAVVKARLARARWSAEADQALMEHRWKGNVRELRRAVEHAMLAANGHAVRPEHLPFETEGGISRVRRWDEAHRRLRVELLEGAMKRSGGNQAAAARELGLTRQTLLYHLKKLRPHLSDSGG